LIALPAGTVHVTVRLLHIAEPAHAYGKCMLEKLIRKSQRLDVTPKAMSTRDSAGTAVSFNCTL
jgi:hypothetical protein